VGKAAVQSLARSRTIDNRHRVVRRFVGFSGEYPWNWTAVHVDEWSTSLIAEDRRAKSTIRNYQGTIRIFATTSLLRTTTGCRSARSDSGTHPIQICYEWNTSAHLQEYEGDRTGDR